MLFFHLRYMRSCGVEARLVRHILDAHLQKKVIKLKQIFRIRIRAVHAPKNRQLAGVPNMNTHKLSKRKLDIHASLKAPFK